VPGFYKSIVRLTTRGGLRHVSALGSIITSNQELTLPLNLYILTVFNLRKKRSMVFGRDHKLLKDFGEILSRV